MGLPAIDTFSEHQRAPSLPRGYFSTPRLLRLVTPEAVEDAESGESFVPVTELETQSPPKAVDNFIYQPGYAWELQDGIKLKVNAPLRISVEIYEDYAMAVLPGLPGKVTCAEQADLAVNDLFSLIGHDFVELSSTDEDSLSEGAKVAMAFLSTAFVLLGAKA